MKSHCPCLTVPRMLALSRKKNRKKCNRDWSFRCCVQFMIAVHTETSGQFGAVRDSLAIHEYDLMLSPIRVLLLTPPTMSTYRFQLPGTIDQNHQA